VEKFDMVQILIGTAFTCVTAGGAIVAFMNRFATKDSVAAMATKESVDGVSNTLNEGLQEIGKTLHDMAEALSDQKVLEQRVCHLEKQVDAQETKLAALSGDRRFLNQERY
jgi:uncharacterized Fe-S cluster-containing protein